MVKACVALYNYLCCVVPQLQDTSLQALQTQLLFLERCSVESGGDRWKETATSRTQGDCQEPKYLKQLKSQEKTSVGTFRHLKDLCHGRKTLSGGGVYDNQGT